MQQALVQIVQHLLPGGIESMALDLKQFNQQQPVYIISLEGTYLQAKQQWPRIADYADSLFFLNKRPGFRWQLIQQLRQLLRQLNATTVHTHHIGPLIYGGLAARLEGVKTLIHTEHDAWHLRDQHHRFLQQWLLRIANPILVADAKRVADGLKTYLPKSNPLIIYNGIDTERFTPGNKIEARQRLGLPTDVKLIGCAARLTAVKNHKLLLDALYRLDKDVHLALAGSGPCEQALREQAQELGDQHRVHFLGHIDQMQHFYQALDLFCLTSVNEGFPLSPLEAQACGVRAVLTAVGGCYETLCPNSGYLVSVNDSAQLARTLKQALSIQYYPNPRDFVLKQGDVRLMVNQYQSLQYAM